MSPHAVVIYCGLLLTITAFSIDITLPAFGLIAEALETPYGQVQLVVPIFVLAVGFSQIFTGPLSDRFGRRPVIIGGVSLYALGTIVCFVSPTIEILLTGRVLQGLGAAVGPVVGRAILRDMFEGRPLARNMALANMMFAFGPIVAPLLGVSIMSLGNWRSIFLVIALFGLALLIVGWLFLPETITNKDREAIRPQKLLCSAKTVLTHPQSRFYLLMSGPISAVMLTILISIPRVYRDSFGIEGTMFAIMFALHGLGIIVGQIINRRAITAFGTAAAMKGGAAVLFASACIMLSVHQAEMMSGWVMTGILIFLATGFLVVASNAAALALDPNGQIAGFVSSLYGLFERVVASTIAIIAARYIGGEVSAFIFAMLLISGSVLVILLIADPSRKKVHGR